MTKTIFAAALAAALAMPAAAQQDTESGRAARERMRRGAGQAGVRPAPTPAPGQAQGQAGQPQGQPLTEEQRTAFGALHALSQLAAQAGDLATSRGTSPEVQSLGRTLAQDHRHIDATLAMLASERGADLSSFAPGAEQERLQRELGELGMKTGAEFDPQFIAFMTRNGNAFVDALKRARDVTPGKDARLKKFLDDTENASEAHLTSARQLKSQRQARTPPQR